ncbi:MAG: 6-phosphofructokinase [Oscillospiraceae bacterium]|nr:6-phosphofructokinase [Oscillospiraceae bacterium]
MSLNIKTIGVLTSGGDAPGMNAAIRAVVRTAIFKGIKVMGFTRGYTGLIKGEFSEMNIRSVSEIIHRGGTVLHTSRCLEFKTTAGVEKARDICNENGIDAVVAIGGDGTMKGAKNLSEAGIPTILIPATIDNDVGCSDYSIGFDTALNTAMLMIDKLRDTAQSHERCSVVEVMGRSSGYLAMTTGIACGALSILIPEVEFDVDRDIIDRMLYTQRTGKRHFIVVVAEGSGSAMEIAELIRAKTGIETTATILGHVQRGGSPTLEDRYIASLMGVRAAELLAEGIGKRAVVMKHGQIMDFDIDEALNMRKTIDKDLAVLSQKISI